MARLIRVKLYTALALVLVINMGCASTRLSMPPPKVPGEGAHVTFIRNFQTRGWPTRVTVDGLVVANIGPGRHITVALDPGVRSLGVAKLVNSYELKAGEHYYFFISVAHNGNGFKMEPLDKATAKPIMASYKAVL